MARFTHVNLINHTESQKQITVLMREDEKDQSGVVAEVFQFTLDDALSRLRVANERLNSTEGSSSKVLSLAHTFFRTDKARLKGEELSFIRTVILKTLNGLSGDATFKAGKKVGPGDKDVLGSVVLYGDPTLKGNRTEVVDMTDMTTANLDDVKTRKMAGTIHIDLETLIENKGKMNSNGVVTLIHEATHKHAGTGDYNYFVLHERKCYSTGPSGKNVNFIMVRSDGLRNADSYAWFAYMLGKR